MGEQGVLHRQQATSETEKANCNTATLDFEDVLNMHIRCDQISAEDQAKFVGFEFNIDANNPLTI
ncbi:hypothetical protein PHMEG_00020959 [Phytophthora megakarya]|uniref:Uncharacterized protein n=1 Tax=Phytophthora megakarya TaxID=4795 RepID=A0A225VQD9_9STRA|nr:hypothetical protein PHMEG_00020959 [Phytophthora megakarya]